MKSFYLIFTFLVTTPVTNVAQTWQWAKTADGSGDGYSVTTDLTGNLYIGGEYLSTNSLIAGNYTLTGGGLINGYLIKYDPNGNVIWARTSVSTGSNGNRILSVRTNSIGDVFVCGYFCDPTVTFGSFTLTNTGSENTFLVKYDSNGNVVWARNSDGIGMTEAWSVAIDPSGSAFMTGNFTNPVSFGAYTLNPTGGQNIFLVKYNASGNVVWATNPSGSAADRGRAVDSDPSGNAIITGDFQSPTLIFGTYTLNNAGSKDIFLAKYDPSGNILWAQNGIGSGDDGGNALNADASGNLYLTGYFKSPTVIFGTSTLNLGGSGESFFLTKYDANGNALWARSSIGDNVIGRSVSTYSGDVFVGGSLSSTMALNGNTIVPPGGSTDPIFIARYDASGNIIYSTTLASGGDDKSELCMDRLCNVYYTSDFQPSSFVVGTNTLTSSGSESVYLSKLSYCSANPDGMIEFEVQGADFSFFPNPNNGSFIVKSMFTTETIIYDDLGKKVKSFTLDDTNNHQTQISGLGAGIYFIKSKDHAKKIVVIK